MFMVQYLYFLTISLSIDFWHLLHSSSIKNLFLSSRLDRNFPTFNIDLPLNTDDFYFLAST